MTAEGIHARQTAAPLDPAPSAPPVPGAVWAAAALVIVLRAIPFAAIVLDRQPAGIVAVPAAFVQRDWLAYVALIRQGWGPFANPFTTDPQGHRIILLLHQALGGIHAVTGADPFWLLELARVPAVLAFTWALWRLAGRVHPDPAIRVWACVLALLSGGVAFAVRAAAPWLPEPIRQVVQQDLWSAYGWSAFDAAFNPIWMVGLALALLVLTPLVHPRGPRSPREAVVVSAAFLGTWLVHPYSAVAAGAAAAGALASAWISGEPDLAARFRRFAAALLPGAVAVGALALWQRGDPVFRASSGGFFGPQLVTVGWYPVTLAALGFFALRGLRTRAERRDPWRHGLAGWAGAIALLHASNVVNGYHFVFALHVPLALLAAEPARAWLVARRSQGLRGRLAAVAVGALLFASPLGTTVADVQEPWLLDGASARLLADLAARPAGNVLAPSGLALLVPAYSPHHVFAGHWFMTPDYEARAARADALTSDPSRARELAAEVAAHRIDHVVLLRAMVPAAIAAGVPVARVTEHGRFALLDTHP